MGFELTWLFVETSDRETLFRDLAVRPTGVLVDDVDGIAGRVPRNDAYLVVANNDQGRHMEPPLLRRLPRDTPLLVCHVHEGCMFSHAASWVGGEEI